MEDEFRVSIWLLGDKDMRVYLAVAAIMAGLALAPTAFADCVDYSEARAKKAGAALEKNPPSAAKLGVPTLEGLRLDGLASTGDPACNGAIVSRYVYRSNFTSAQVLETIYPYIEPATSTDGMKRVWYQNPMSGRGEVQLTSGAIVQIPQSNTAADVKVVIYAPKAMADLTQKSQPYSISDILEGTPWPGGASGKRQFVRADGGPSGYASSTPTSSSPSTSSVTADQSPTAQNQCQPTDSAQAARTGSAVGADLGGAVIGGGYGRSVGSAAGAVLGGLGGLAKKKKDQPAQQSGC